MPHSPFPQQSKTNKHKIITTLAAASPEDPNKRFVRLIQLGGQAWAEAAAIAREQIEKDPEWPEKIAAENRMFTAEAVLRFSRIGVKYIPELFGASGAGVAALRRMPLDVQKKYVNAPVPVLVNPSGTWEELPIDVNNLTPEQVKQVFNGDHIRSAAEQRAWIESERTQALTATPPKHNPPYRVVKNEMVVMVPCRISKREMLAAFGIK